MPSSNPLDAFGYPLDPPREPGDHAKAKLDVRALRERMRGDRQPTGSALVLLAVIHENPRVVLKAVRKARMWRPGMLPDIAPKKSYRAPPGFGDGTYVWRD